MFLKQIFCEVEEVFTLGILLGCLFLILDVLR